MLRSGALGPELLLMRRAERAGDPWSGQVSLPGGRRQPEDADLLATALREAREEVGLDLAADAELLCRLAPLRARTRGRLLDLDVTPFAFRLGRAVEATPDQVEARAVFWLPLARAARGELDDEVELVHEERALRLPAWRFDEHVVWGMTHRMVTRLMTVAGWRCLAPY